MLRRDYLVRMIEEMTEIIGKVFGLKQQKKYTEALWELDDLYKGQFRLSSQLLGTLSAKDIVKLFQNGGELEANKLQSLAKLLKEEGDVYIASGKSDEGLSRWMKSLHLYLEASLNGADRSLWDWEQRIRELQLQLKDYRLLGDTEMLILRFEEREGRYDLAENALYRLLHDKEIHKEEAQAFYIRLLALTPAQLEEGGLPLEEVKEGLEELESYF